MLLVINIYYHIYLWLGLIELGIGLIELGMGLIELGIGLIEFRIGLSTVFFLKSAPGAFEVEI